MRPICARQFGGLRSPAENYAKGAKQGATAMDSDVYIGQLLSRSLPNPRPWTATEALDGGPYNYEPGGRVFGKTIEQEHEN
jgi:hypothetical protein